MKGYSEEVERAILKMTRTPRATNGSAPSKMMSFRISADNVAFLNQQSNKNGLVNYLLRCECARRISQAEEERKENGGQ